MSELIKSEATLTRNEVTVPLYIGEFGKLSKENQGLKFPYPIVDTNHFDRDIKMIGKDFVSDSMTKILRRIFGAIQVECWNKETGEINTDQWNEMASEFTEGEEKRDTLQEKKNILSDRFATITESEDFMASPDKYSEELKAIGEDVSSINNQLKSIQAKIDETTAKRNAKKAENAAILAKRLAEVKTAPKHHA